MQEVSATDAVSERLAQLQTSALVDTSSQAQAFSDFLTLMGSSTDQAGGTTLSSQANATEDTTHDLTPYLDSSARIDTSHGPSTLVRTVPDSATTQTDDATETTAQTAQIANASTTNQTTKNASSTATNTASSNTASADTASSDTTSATSSSGSSNADLADRNTPVTRESFEKAKPLLTQAGLSDEDIEKLSAKVQAGTLTWGQLVQTLGGHLSGGKDSVSLDDTEKDDLRGMFQKLGFSQSTSATLTQSMADGNGQQVFRAVMGKLSNMDGDDSPGLDKDEVSTFLKGLRVPEATADKLTASLGDDATAAQLKNAFAQGAGAVQQQFAQTSDGDVKLAKQLGKLMESDAAKAKRDAQTTTGSSGDSGEEKVGFELKTKGKDDTSFFSQHEKTQDQKTSDDSWNKFLDKVHTDDSGSGQSASQQSSGQSQSAASQVKAALQDVLGAAGSATGLSGQSAATNGTSSTTQTTKAFSNVRAPQILEQVNDALLKNLTDGTKQLTLSLEPESLGKVDVTLQVKGKEVTAVLQADNTDTTKLLASQLQTLRKGLEDQGLTVQNLEVQSGLTSNQQQQQFSAEEHNQAQEQQEMNQIMSRLRLLRSDGSGAVQGVQAGDVQAIIADHGLHLIA